jgi:hypothetical protein
LFDVKLLGPGLGMPFDFQIVAKLSEFLGVFARQHDGAGAKSVTEGVHANSSLSLGCLGASRFLGVASIGLELFDCCHIVILTNKAKFGGCGRSFGRFRTNKAKFGGYYSLILLHFVLFPYFYSHNSAADQADQAKKGSPAL